jgi:hypothetical protein
MEDFKFTREDVKEILLKILKSCFSDNGTNAVIDDLIQSKRPKPLFITEDGAEVYEDQHYFDVNPNFKIIECTARYYADNDNKHFSTREAAENYVLYNNPFEVTLKELKEGMPFSDIDQYVSDVDQLRYLKNLAIKKQNTGE